MPDYAKTIIYKLINYDYPDLIYIGSTTNFTKRKQHHKEVVYKTTSPKYNRKLYISIRENGGWENWEMISICDYPCKDRREAEKEEDRYMMELKANLNMIRPFRTHDQYMEDNKEVWKQYKVKYYQDNKDKIKQYKNKYYEENKDIITDKKKEYYENNKDTILAKQHKIIDCLCGGKHATNNKARHLKSHKHQTYLINHM
jgi:hypothetical protein